MTQISHFYWIIWLFQHNLTISASKIKIWFVLITVHNIFSDFNPNSRSWLAGLELSYVAWQLDKMSSALDLINPYNFFGNFGNNLKSPKDFDSMTVDTYLRLHTRWQTKCPKWQFIFIKWQFIFIKWQFIFINKLGRGRCYHYACSSITNIIRVGFSVIQSW